MIIGTQCSLAMRHIFGAQSPKFFTSTTKITKSESEPSEATNEKENVTKHQDMAWILLEVLLKIKKQEENAKR